MAKTEYINFAPEEFLEDEVGPIVYTKKHDIYNSRTATL
jgi:hypothetical protein